MKTSKINFGSKSNTSIFAKKEKPAAVQYSSDTPDIESDCIDELTDLQKAFREKAKKEKELQDKNTSSDFWSCIVFQNEEQRNRFYELLGLKEEDNQYINGRKLIQALEMQIDTMETKAPGKFKCNKDILQLAINIS